MIPKHTVQSSKSKRLLYFFTVAFRPEDDAFQQNFVIYIYSVFNVQVGNVAGEK